MRSAPDILDLAKARYPKVPLTLALRYFSSDRRHAGLGALDASRRRPRRHEQVRNYKELNLVDGRVYYTVVRDTPLRWDYPRDEPMYALGAPMPPIQLIQTPAVCAVRKLPVQLRDLDDQAGRRRIAMTLLRLRAEIKKAGKQP